MQQELAFVLKSQFNAQGDIRIYFGGHLRFVIVFTLTRVKIHPDPMLWIWWEQAVARTNTNSLWEFIEFRIPALHTQTNDE